MSLINIVILCEKSKATIDNAGERLHVNLIGQTCDYMCV